MQHDIILNGHAFTIRQNLYSALKSISDHVQMATDEQNTSAEMSAENTVYAPSHLKKPPQCWKYFWIDAICIDQDAVFERNHQVRMMSEIYKSATFVLVWFGTKCEEALHLINTATPAKLRSVYKPYTGILQSTSFAQALVPLLENEYWTRMWIVQEFVLAKDLLFASGSVLAHWDHVHHIFPDIYEYLDYGSYSYHLAVVNERRQHLFRQLINIRPCLHELVRRFGYMACSDVRDKVFALHGLLEENSNQASPFVIVDYTLTPAQLALRMLELASQTLKRRPLEDFDRWLVTTLQVGQEDGDHNGDLRYERGKLLKKGLTRHAYN